MKKFILKKLINDIGYYVEFEFAAKRIRETVISIDIKNKTSWDLMINAGCHAFFDRYSKQNSSGLEVVVQDFKWRIIDSSPTVVFAGIQMALQEHLEFEGELVILDENGRFIIPK